MVALVHCMHNSPEGYLPGCEALVHVTVQHQGVNLLTAVMIVQAKVEEVEHALYGAQRAKEEAAKRAALEERLAKRAAEREKIDKAKDWSEEEVRMLEKALDKFPPVRIPSHPPSCTADLPCCSC